MLSSFRFLPSNDDDKTEEFNDNWNQHTVSSMNTVMTGDSNPKLTCGEEAENYSGKKKSAQRKEWKQWQRLTIWSRKRHDGDELGLCRKKKAITKSTTG